MTTKKNETQTTPDEEFDLDAVMEEGMETFEEDMNRPAEDISGSSAADTNQPGPASAEDTENPNKEPEKEEPASDTKSESEAAPPKEPEPDKEPKDTPASDTDAAPKEESQKKPDEKPDADKKDFRFTSHDEAEKGYKSLQGEKTRVEQRNKELEKELQSLRDAEQLRKDQAAADEKIMDYAVERHKESLAEIDALDPDDAEYQDEVAKIWARKDRDIRNYEREHGVGGSTPAQAKDDTKTAPADETSALTYVQEEAKKHDIDPDDPLFLAYCAQAPTTNEDGSHRDLANQVEWAITKTNDYLAAHERRYNEAQKKEAAQHSKEHQEREVPLGRSTSDSLPSHEEEAKPVSLDDAIEDAANERRL